MSASLRVDRVRRLPLKRIDPVAALPLAAQQKPLGIVIKSGGPTPKPARFWAYLWAADEESAEDHWHQRVPTEHAA
jgi:hypothetical protein